MTNILGVKWVKPSIHLTQRDNHRDLNYRDCCLYAGQKPDFKYLFFIWLVNSNYLFQLTSVIISYTIFMIQLN